MGQTVVELLEQVKKKRAREELTDSIRWEEKPKDAPRWWRIKTLGDKMPWRNSHVRALGDFTQHVWETRHELRS